MAGLLSCVRRKLNTYHRYRSVRIVVLCVLCLWMLHLVVITLMNSNQSKVHVQVFQTREFLDKKVKKILFWTPFLSTTFVEEQKQCISKCSTKCEITDDKDDIADSDAVNFHLSNLWTKIWSIGTKATIKFPTYRRSDQVWILSNMEPPHHLWGDLTVFNNLFNWTNWYRSDATIQWPYGASVTLNETERVKATEALKGRNLHAEKSHEIFGRISNCLDPGRRYRTVRSMQQYLDVDMYGLCYDRPCGNPHDQWDKSCDQLMRKYKFYIAFENAQCKDYVTEKYWWAPDRDQIPIVNWNPHDKHNVHPNSYININHFKDMASFAKYITRVSRDELLYNSYFDWKKTRKNDVDCMACTICKELQDKTRPAQLIADLDTWVQDDTCEKVGYINDALKHIHSWAFWYLGI